MGCFLCSGGRGNPITQTSFSPTASNWMFSATKGANSYYFQNVTSFNAWAGSCCSDTGAALRRGYTNNGFTLTRNGF